LYSKHLATFVTPGALPSRQITHQDALPCRFPPAPI
jgi:hypothetical protein